MTSELTNQLSPEKAHTLRISRARNGLRTPEDILIKPDDLEQRAIDLGGGVVGTLFIKNTRQRTPEWASFFEGFVPAQDFGQTKSAGAVLLVPIKDHMFVLTFGMGRFLVQPDVFESRFGLRVTLNSIGEATVRSIDKDTFDRLGRHTREQASRDAAPREFGLDIEQDLLRAVTGTPTDTAMGRRISGRDSLAVSAPIEIRELPEFLERIGERAGRTTYQRNFPWVDHLAHVTDKTRIDELDSLLVDGLRGGQHDQIWMAVPEPVDWEMIRGFRFPFRRATPEYQDVHLEQFLQSVGSVGEIDRGSLDRVVEAINHDGEKTYRWRAYRCIYCELNHQRSTYVLTGGSWYKIKGDFVYEVNEAYERIPNFGRELPEYDDDSEAAYVVRVAQSAPDRFFGMDRKTVQYGGGRSKIEFCDLYTRDRDVVHIKRYGQSSALSHLFAQGLTFGEVFLSDPALRERFNELVPARFRIRNVQQRPRTEEYCVVFAVVTDRPGDLVLPFFSRLNFKHSARRLEAYGYRVAKAKIEVREERARLQRLPARGRH